MCFNRTNPKTGQKEPTGFGKFIQGFGRGAGGALQFQQPAVGGGGALPQVMNDPQLPDSPLLQSLLARIFSEGNPFGGVGGIRGF